MFFLLLPRIQVASVSCLHWKVSEQTVHSMAMHAGTPFISASPVQFLTNAFMVPYMAVRERLPETDARGKPPKESPRPLASFSKLFGGVALFISVVSLFWLFQVSFQALNWRHGRFDNAGPGAVVTGFVFLCAKLTV